jgi:hypothetical protein
MSLGFLDVNDCNLELWHQSGSTRSPGYALLENNTYVFGEQARAAARLKPREVNTRYWWQLSTEPLQPSMGSARHPGDLAHAHLTDLHQRSGSPEHILLAVPGSMAKEQLSLLLGIMQHSPFSAVGMVNRSVALGSLHTAGEELWHLEVQLHQMLLSHLIIRDEQVLLERTITLPGCGLIQTQERLAGVIANAFVEQTRFDPRQKAITEQALYNALPSALGQLQSAAETNLELNGHQARIAKKHLESIGSELLESVAAAIGESRPKIITDAIFGLLPAPRNILESLVVLSPNDMHKALMAHQSILVQKSGSLPYVTSLPMLQGLPTDTKTGSAEGNDTNINMVQSASKHPTHLLQAATAEPLLKNGTSLKEGVEIRQENSEWLIKHGDAVITLNGRDYVANTPLQAGDILIVENQNYTLIKVES